MKNSKEMNLYTSKESKKIDRLAIKQKNISSFSLMEMAAKSAFFCLIREWPEAKEMVVFCGRGNNGGDGYLLASIAKERGLKVTVVNVGNQKRISPQVIKTKKIIKNKKIRSVSFKNFKPIKNKAIFVDALIGTGLKGNVRKEFQEVINFINKKDNKTLSLDLPSGICSDTGNTMGASVKADITVSFIVAKKGCFTSDGRSASGSLHLERLGIKNMNNQVNNNCSTLSTNKSLKKITNRESNSHKGDFGHLLIVGGNLGYGGAAILASKAAAHSGCGLVSLATRKEHISASLLSCPEVMANAVNSGQDLDALVKLPDSIVIGPGLGKDAWAEQMLQVCLREANKRKLNLVIDADGLNLISKLKIKLPKNNLVITPHPGEAARLLKKEIKAVQENRFESIRLLQKKFNCVSILKGSGTLICYKDSSVQKTKVCEYGNPGMARGGMGDVLSGIIGSFLAQGLNTKEATCLAVNLHSMSADLCSLEKGELGMMPSHLIENLQIFLRS